MVALVHKNVKHIWDVKGKRLCHPGLDIENELTKAISMVSVSPTTRIRVAVTLPRFIEPDVSFQYFENWIIPRECDPDKTLLENRMYALSNHFEMACVAGLWSLDTIFDAQLSKQFNPSDTRVSHFACHVYQKRCATVFYVEMRPLTFSVLCIN